MKLDFMLLNVLQGNKVYSYLKIEMNYGEIEAASIY